MSGEARLFEGKVGIVTGGATGIGRGLMRGLAAAGARVTIASRKEDRLRAAAAEVVETGCDAPHVEVCDVRDAESCERMVKATAEKFGRLDFLVNNAGANFLCPAMAISANGWRAVVETVLNGTFFCSVAAARVMMECGGGAIVNMAATNGWNGSPLIAHSGAAKAGVLNLTETLAVEWAPFKIRVNAVAPGPVATEGAKERLWREDDARRRIEEAIPLGRMASVDDCVQATLFLLSPAAAYITGTTLAVDGGERLRNWNRLGPLPG
ncbi:MAG: SDR family oxidoreductase [Deltaproteobacteria bacterium]|nr:SDR family oxidoreductase [Deltaproteobacteria bacterium]